MRKNLIKKFFDQVPGSGSNNFISCLDNSLSENQFGIIWQNRDTSVKEVF
jgi:hypothetical protein